MQQRNNAFNHKITISLIIVVVFTYLGNHFILVVLKIIRLLNTIGYYKLPEIFKLALTRKS